MGNNCCWMRRRLTIDTKLDETTETHHPIKTIEIFTLPHAATKRQDTPRQNRETQQQPQQQAQQQAQQQETKIQQDGFVFIHAV